MASFDDDFDAQLILAANAMLDELDKKTTKESPRIVDIQSAASLPPESSSIALPTPIDFQFPFAPYLIQTDFMRALFETLESSRVGIFESPTGTGKSLSLLCASLSWLRSDEQRRRAEFDRLIKKQEDEEKGDDDDWIGAFARKEETQTANRDFLERQRRLDRRRKELDEWKRNTKLMSYRMGMMRKRKTIGFGASPANKSESTVEEEIERADAKDDDDEELDPDDASMLLDDYDSDCEAKSTKKTDDEDERQQPIDTPKIIYCSRTHSQLAQFLREIKKTTFAKELRCVTLGSRQTFCVNDTVRKSGAGDHHQASTSLINDRCLQMQKDKASAKNQSSKKSKSLDVDGTKKSKTAGGGCPFHKTNNIDEMANSILMDGIRDVENLIDEAKDSKSCPYYASRRAVADAQLVLAPYQILLHESTRDACGLKLSGNVVIVDEAHNLLDTISSIHSIEVNAAQLESARVQSQRYLERFSTRLNAKNLMYIRILGVVLEKLVGFVKAIKQGEDERVYGLTDFLFQADIDTINMFKLVRYIEASRIGQKLNAYANRESSSNIVSNSNENSTVLSPFHSVSSFLRCLVQRVDDGRIISTPAPSTSPSSSRPASKSSGGANRYAKLKFVHLNPAVYFEQICTEARSIILAGGTMEPINDLIDQLFLPCGIRADSIRRFSCGHTVDDENLLPMIMDKGPSGVQFDFTYTNRSDESMIRELGRVLTNLSNVVPGGIVCFFQSYDYEATVVDRWTSWGVVRALEKKKKLFREPARAVDVNGVLENFAKHATIDGALMLAVVGGKLSEGINFADDLGRLVVMIGLPFPNAHSIELKEKMRFLSEQRGSSGGGKDQTTRGQEYYENLCMKAVNQSIGRVIRHRDDYAAILLLDKGYSRLTIRKKLPSWIGKLMSDGNNDSFGVCFGKTKQFFDRLGMKYAK